MIGLVLVTHGRLAEEFLAALEHIVGPQEQTAAICIGPDDDMERRRGDILREVEAVDTGDGVAVLTDMFGGTPSNLAISIMEPAKVEVLAGINLPMLIKLAAARSEEGRGDEGQGENDLKSAVTAAQEAGRKYINIASALLSDKD